MLFSRCLHYLHTSTKLEIHAIDCGKFNNYAIRLPSEDKWLSFSNRRRKERVPFYADLKCTLQKMKMDMKTSSYTYQQHRVFSLAYYAPLLDNSLCMYRFRRDTNCIAWFAEKLKNLAHNVNTILSANILMTIFTRDNWQKFNSAMNCHVCEKSFAPDDTRVRDHCTCDIEAPRIYIEI